MSAAEEEAGTECESTDHMLEYDPRLSPYLDSFMVITKIEEGMEVPVMAEYENPVQREGNMEIEVDLVDADLAAKIEATLLETEFYERQAQNIVEKGIKPII